MWFKNVFFYFCKVNRQVTAEDADCDDVPEDSPFQCCKVPQSMIPKSVIEKIGPKIKPFLEKGGIAMGLCKGTEILLEDLKIYVKGEYSEAAMEEYTKSNLKDNPEFGELMKTAGKECAELVKPNADEYQKENGIPKEECDAISESFFMCTLVRLFGVRYLILSMFYF